MAVGCVVAAGKRHRLSFSIRPRLPAWPFIHKYAACLAFAFFFRRLHPIQLILLIKHKIGCGTVCVRSLSLSLSLPSPAWRGPLSVVDDDDSRNDDKTAAAACGSRRITIKDLALCGRKTEKKQQQKKHTTQYNNQRAAKSFCPSLSFPSSSNTDSVHACFSSCFLRRRRRMQGRRPAAAVHPSIIGTYERAHTQPGTVRAPFGRWRRRMQPCARANKRRTREVCALLGTARSQCDGRKGGWMDGWMDIYIHIYVSVSVCVCMCVCVYARARSLV